LKGVVFIGQNGSRNSEFSDCRKRQFSVLIDKPKKFEFTVGLNPLSKYKKHRLLWPAS